MCANCEALEAERDALLREKAGRETLCVWTEDSDGMWRSACGLVDWCFNDGGPEENKMKFCNGCAHPLAAEPYEDNCGHPVEVKG